MKFELSSKSIHELLKERARQTPENSALTYASGSLNYRELEARSAELAGCLFSAGIRHGARVAFMADPGAESVALLYGLMRLGAVAVMVSPFLNEENLSYALSVSDAADLIVSTGQQPAKVPDGIRIWSLHGDFGRKLPSAKEEEAEDVRKELDTSDAQTSGMVIFTSGTTSHPKAVFLNQYRILNNARCHREFFHVTEKDRFLAALPMEHILCVIITMLLPLVSGACMCITKDKHTASIVETIEKERCTFLCGVPTMYHAIIEKQNVSERDLSCLRTGMTGGAPCSPALFAEIEEKLGICLVSTLGQTETAGGFTMYRDDETKEERYNSVGVPSWNMEVKIEDGEICVKGYLVSEGYLKKEEETAALIDRDGWLHTGDLGRFDEKGLLYVTGRKKDVIIRGGENISAVAVENILGACPGVSEVKCFGVPDSHYGEEICACLRANAGEKLSEEAVREYAKKNLENWKIPRYIIIMEDFPRTDVGKVKTGELRQSVLKELGIR